MNVLAADEARRQLIDYHHMDPAHARRAVDIAREHGAKAVPTDDGYLTVTRVNHNSFVIEDGHRERAETRTAVAARTQPRYNSRTNSRPARPATARKQTIKHREGTKKMAPATAEAEVKDYTVYADKAPTQVMSDFADWLETEVGVEYGTAKEREAFRNGVRLGGTLRMEFQRSETNQARLEARRAEKEGAPATKPAATKPTRAAKAPAGKRGAAKPAAATATKPTRARRGAPKAGAKAEAPF